MTAETRLEERFHGNRLLLKCLTLDRAQEMGFDPGELTSQDWELVWELAKTQALTPLLYYRNSESGIIESLPGEIGVSLRQNMLTSVKHKTHFSQALSDILAAFNRASLELVALKGSHLAELIYEDPALRVIGDIDLLVHERDLLACDACMLELGYGPSKRTWIQNEFTATHHHLPYYRKPGHPHVELHWTITKPETPPAIDLDGLWQRTRAVSIAGVQTRVLSTQDLILHICIHACYDNLFSDGIRSIVDLYQIIQSQKGEIDWGLLLEISARWRVNRCLYLMLHLTHQLAGAEVPKRVFRSLQPADMQDDIVLSAQNQLFSQVHGSRNFSRLVGTEGLIEKAGTIMGRVFLSPGEMYRKYDLEPGSPRLYWSYLRRIKELGLRYGGELVDALRSRADSGSTARNQRLLLDWLSAG